MMEQVAQLYNKEHSFLIQLADRKVEVFSLFPATKQFCRDYLTEGTPDFSICITPSDINFEKEKSAAEDRYEGKTVREFSEEYLETLAVYRKIVEQMPEHNTFLFHGSVVAVDNQAYLFTAKSGTGKSTHVRFWREYFGSRAVMVNDDKPLIKVEKDGVKVYGTPWAGKHNLQNNIAVPLKAICRLERGSENHIKKISARDIYPLLLQQTYRPFDQGMLERTLSLLDDLSMRVEFYRLNCNMSVDAARVAYEGMED